MKVYVSDTEDLKQDPLYQETWDDMIVHVSFRILNSYTGKLGSSLFHDLFSDIHHTWLKRSRESQFSK